MSEQKNKFYLTTPIYYVNARPHIGHAYTTIVADVLARRHRLLGDDTFFLTGTDEHGQKIERSAAAAGIPPQQFADQVSASFESLWKRMGITHDRFIRTTDPAHKLGVQKLFSTLYERGFIELKAYTGSYCVSDEAFVDAPVGTPCPDCGRLLEEVTEENFFFKLSAFQRPLLDLIESGILQVEPESRRNEVLSFMRGNVAAATDVTPNTGIQLDAKYGSAPDADTEPSALSPGPSLLYSDLGHAYVFGALKDLSISRSSFTWGVPVPEPAASTASQKHVIYVWLDALANYMTAIGYGATAEEAQAQFARYWPADLHLVGKEIIRFHCVYWPAFLLAAGLPLPKAITAHGWLLFDNSKMSKSKGNIVRTETILDAFGTLCPPPANALSSRPEQSGVERSADHLPQPSKADRDLFAADILRYFLLREIPFGQDGTFSFEAMITRYNADLANGYGNLVSRTLNMIDQYFGGLLPDALAFDGNVGAFKLTDGQPRYTTLSSTAVIASIQTRVESREFDSYLQKVAECIADVDGFISQTAPWKLAKSAEQDDRKDLATVLSICAESIRIITALLYPILPYATARVWAQLGLGDIEQAARNGELRNPEWGGLQPGTKLGPLGPIFPRADKGLAQIMTDMENPSTPLSSELAAQSSSRPEASLKQAFTPAPAQPVADDPTHPAAPPRTSSLDSLAEPAGTLPVGGSSAITTGPAAPVSHTDAPASGIFASTASQTPVSAGPSDASPQITIDDFAKIELRVAEIKVAERIPKADKLLRLEVDLGYEKRQILSGIAEWYTPEDLVGRRIVVITNLAPRKMRGLESHGMLLAASGPVSDTGEGGKPVLATFAEDIALGSRLK